MMTFEEIIKAIESAPEIDPAELGPSDECGIVPGLIDAEIMALPPGGTQAKFQREVESSSIKNAGAKPVLS